MSASGSFHGGHYVHDGSIQHVLVEPLIGLCLVYIVDIVFEGIQIRRDKWLCVGMTWFLGRVRHAERNIILLEHVRSHHALNTWSQYLTPWCVRWYWPCVFTRRSGAVWSVHCSEASQTDNGNLMGINVVVFVEPPVTPFGSGSRSYLSLTRSSWRLDSRVRRAFFISCVGLEAEIEMLSISLKEKRIKIWTLPFNITLSFFIVC